MVFLTVQDYFPSSVVLSGLDFFFFPKVVGVLGEVCN